MDRVYPSAKPNGTTVANKPATNGAANPPQFPATKSQLNNPNRHPYRPQTNTQRRRRSHRSCLCLCCFWSILLITAILLLAAIAGCVMYVLYSPKRPEFSVTALRISQFNLSTAADDTTHITSSLNLTVSATNPNKKLVYVYDPVSISADASNGVEIGYGSFPSFTTDPQNVTIIRSVLSESSQVVDADSATALRSDLKKKIGLPLKIVMDTKVVVHVEKMKGKKLGIRVTCDGILGVVPKGKSPSIASTANAKCKVDLRIKIWKWTF